MASKFAAAIGRIGERLPVGLLVPLAPLAGLLLFVSLADQVVDGQTHRIDERIVRSFRRADDPATPIGPAWIAEASRDLTALGSPSVLVLMTAIAAGYLLIHRKSTAATFVVAAVGTGWALSSALKAAFQRPRPDVVPHLTPARFSSFPSGHSMMSAIVYVTLGALLARLVPGRRHRVFVVATALLLTVIVGATRVYLGVHYPSDVLAGWCAGLTWASACWIVERQLQRRGVIEGGSDRD